MSLSIQMTSSHTVGGALIPSPHPLTRKENSLVRVSYRGGPWNWLLMVINVLSRALNNNLVPDCVGSNLRGSKFKIFMGEHAP